MVTKSKRAFRTISEAADDLGVQQHVLRFWESKFSQIKPMKRGGNRRFYRPDDIALLKAIKHSLYDGDLSIKDAQTAIKLQGVKTYVQAWKDEVGYVEPVIEPKKKAPPIPPSRPVEAPTPMPEAASAAETLPEPVPETVHEPAPEPAPEPEPVGLEEILTPPPVEAPEQPGLQFETEAGEAAPPEEDDSIKVSKDLVRALVADLKALRALIDRIPD